MMPRRADLWLFAGGGVIAWTVAASTAFLWFANGTWEVWEPGPFWSDPYFAHGLRWTWAWLSYAAKASTRAAYGTTLIYTALGAATAVGIVVFRLCMLAFGSGPLSVYGKTQWATPAQMKANRISTKRRPF